MKKLIITAVCLLLAIASYAHAEEKDIGVGKNGMNHQCFIFRYNF